MRDKRATADVAVARIASRQHGVVTLAQLAGLGLDRAAVARRVQAGRLHRVQHGVYAVGCPDLTREGRWFAAVASLGPSAVLSHDSAASLWQLSPPTSAVVHVTVPSTNGRCKRRGIVVHRSTSLTSSATTRRHNIPVTTPARTREDLGFGPEPTRSELERAFVRLCKAHSIPEPQINATLGPYTVDCLWRPKRLVVELDSWSFHSSRASFESDRARDRELALRGLEVVRFTYTDVTARSGETARYVKALLERGS